MDSQPYKVTVECRTYNHAPYVTQALEGFVRQRTRFPFVAVVVDDASTDGTQERILAFFREQFAVEDAAVARTEETAEARFFFARHRHNRHCHFAIYLLKTNHISAGREHWEYLDPWRAQASYMAVCEGDDWWTSPWKLRRQARVLDRHPGTGLVYGPARSYLQETGRFGEKMGRRCRGIDPLLYGNVIYTPTVMLRLSCLDGYRPLKKKEWLMGDYPMWLYVAGRSRLRWLRRPMAVYRILAESASHTTDPEKRRRFIESTCEIQQFFADYYRAGDPARLLEVQTRMRAELAATR